MLKQDHVPNFYTFKWGDKYGQEYVIRLRNSLIKYCKSPFNFTCITDNPVDGVVCEDIREYQLFSESVFTAEKMELMHRERNKINVLLDLDILIHNDITDMVTEPCNKPTFVYTHWTPDWHWKELVPKKTACFINSSFVKWSGDTASHIFEHYMKNREMYLKKYNSFDKYVFYEHWLKDKSVLKFWSTDIFYNYNEQTETQYKFMEDRKVCLFNTSHLIKLNRRYYELNNTPTDHTEIWESYDEIN